MRATSDANGEPPDYKQPRIVWLVEAVANDDVENGHFQLGGFTRRRDARAVMRRYEGDSRFSDLHINMVAIHRSVADWEWDR